MQHPVRGKQVLLESVGESTQRKTKPYQTAQVVLCCGKHFLIQGCQHPCRTPLPEMLWKLIRFHPYAITCRVLIPVASLWFEKQKKRTPGRKLLTVILLHCMRLNEGISHQGEGESTPVKTEHQQ